MRRLFAHLALACIAVLIATTAAFAQGNDTRYSLNCNDQDNYGNSRARHCEVKEQTLTAGALDVDGAQNGGISVKGWDRNETLVRYKIQTQAPTQAEADSLASQVRVNTSGGQVRAEGPETQNQAWWSVSYEIFVPRQSDVALHAHNGGISIGDVHGRISFETVNGGVSLRRLGGNVTGETVNGGLSIELAGTNWDGEGLNARTTNGGLSVSVPENYSAHLETGTVNGGFTVSPTIAQIARETKRLSVDLGSGGQNLRIYTTNGGVSIKRSEAR
ncbi:MAG TPA: hypothetical protein VF779_16780 [Pyrinomonadaceae bacterium]